jgi:hypothetical protein
MQRFLLLTALFLSFAILPAQRTLSGIVTDSGTGHPLSFVNVFLKSEQSVGVLTNERGEYTINLSEVQLKDELVFSLMSYQTHFERLTQLEEEQTTFNLRMSSSFVELREIVVLSDLGLKQLVRRAIEAIPRNYGSEDYLLEAYYRQYDIDDGEYAQLIEAMVLIRDKPYNKPDRTPKSWINQFRMSDYTGKAPEKFRTRNNSQHILRGGYNFYTNPARMQKIHWLAAWGEKNEMQFMTFTQRGEYLDGRDTLVKIQYGVDLQTSGLDSTTARAFESFLTGEILINKTDLAFLRVTNGNPEDNWYEDAVYQKVNGKYYVKQLKHVSEFKYNDHTQTHFYNRVLFVTKVITDPKAIKRTRKRKLMDSGKKVHEVTVAYDPNFWERNEIMTSIPAPEAMETELSRIRTLREQFLDNARRVKRDTTK